MTTMMTCYDNDNDDMTVCAGDCDDTDNAVYLGAPEICDGKDNNCDGEMLWEDNDAENHRRSDTTRFGDSTSR